MRSSLSMLLWLSAAVSVAASPLIAKRDDQSTADYSGLPANVLFVYKDKNADCTYSDENDKHPLWTDINVKNYIGNLQEDGKFDGSNHQWVNLIAHDQAWTWKITNWFGMQAKTIIFSIDDQQWRFRAWKKLSKLSGIADSGGDTIFADTLPGRNPGFYSPDWKDYIVKGRRLICIHIPEGDTYLNRFALTHRGTDAEEAQRDADDAKENPK